MRIVSVVGTRPQLIKAAALSPVLRTRHEEIFVDTGQHYDEEMAGAFFAELGLPEPDHSLRIHGGSHAEQTAAMLTALAPIILAVRPDAVVVYGDTNSTLAGALVAAKLVVPIAHVEAGLRSFDRRMPEEINRVVVDHVSHWLFAPTPAAIDNLASEGVTEGVELVGDLMQDLAARVLPGIRDPGTLGTGPLAAMALEAGGYVFATIHRAENRATPAIRAWINTLRAIARPDRPVVLALHPGTRVALEAVNEPLGPHVIVTGPLGYRSSLALQLHAAAVLTDSGGIQRESGWLGVPCLVLRESTEWVELLGAPDGQMALVGLDAHLAVDALERWAPAGSTGILAATRSRDAVIEASGTAAAITARLAADEVPAAVGSPS